MNGNENLFKACLIILGLVVLIMVFIGIKTLMTDYESTDTESMKPISEEVLETIPTTSEYAE